MQPSFPVMSSHCKRACMASCISHRVSTHWPAIAQARQSAFRATRSGAKCLRTSMVCHGQCFYSGNLFWRMLKTVVWEVGPLSDSTSRIVDTAMDEGRKPPFIDFVLPFDSCIGHQVANDFKQMNFHHCSSGDTVGCQVFVHWMIQMIQSLITLLLKLTSPERFL